MILREDRTRRGLFSSSLATVFSEPAGDACAKAGAVVQFEGDAVVADDDYIASDCTSRREDACKHNDLVCRMQTSQLQITLLRTFPNMLGGVSAEDAGAASCEACARL